MDEKLRILLCEDDENLGMLLREYLQAKGYSAELCPDGEAGYKAFLKNKYDLCVLDVMMPKMDGWQVCREIRSYSKVPIIMLTARSDEKDELQGFDLGVDEYISKPFSPKILVARVEAILRRTGKSAQENEVMDVGGIHLDKAEHMVEIDGRRVD